MNKLKLASNEEEVKEKIEETEEQELWDLEEECFWYEKD